MTPNEFYQRLLVMNTGRQILNAEWKCAVHFGGSTTPCADIQAQTTQLYAATPPSANFARTFCSRFGVQYLTLSHRDPPWPGLTGWPASLPVITAQPTSASSGAPLDPSVYPPKPSAFALVSNHSHPGLHAFVTTPRHHPG